MALHGELEGPQQPLGGEKVHDQSLRQLDRLGGHLAHLRIQAEIENQLLGRAGDAVPVLLMALVSTLN
jgi:hypothetical protein